MKKFLGLILIIAVALWAGYGGARADGADLPKSENNSSNALHNELKCPDMIVELGDFRFAVPHNPLAPACGAAFIKKTVLTLPNGVGGLVKISALPKTGTDKGTWYTLYKKEIEEGRREGHSEILPDGVEHLKTPADIFVLPLDKAPTKNGEPVTINCMGDVNRITDKVELSLQDCFTNYVHPLGLYVYEVFSRGGYPRDSDYLEADLKVRARIDAMIKAAEKQSNGQEKEQ